MLWSLSLCLMASAFVTQVAVFSTTIYLHRCATHKALELHPAVAFVFRLGLWLTTGLFTKEWVAVHRKHHAFTEEEGDPHSPHLKGFWSVQLGNVFYYVKEAKNPETVRAIRPRHSGRCLGPSDLPLGRPGTGTGHCGAVLRCWASVGVSWPPEFIFSCTSSFFRPPSTGSAITSVTGTSTILRRTSASWRC